MAPSPGKVRKPISRVFILLALSLVLQCFLWRGKEKLQQRVQLQTSKIARRSEVSAWSLSDDRSHTDHKTMGAIEDILAGHAKPVSDVEEPEGGIFGIDYWDLYNGAKPHVKPFIFAGFVLWGAFLFATIGITASDFFCPNLATVADRLGMAESTAGVTFLAFGNGSPDVFSTFSALRSNTFSLAIGELLGASCFIISVVVGCMALVQPFQVPRWPFIRDVGFFTLSVLILVGCLTDGKLTLIESGGLMLLYVIYVSLIVGGNWWMDRRGRRKQNLLETDHGLANEGRNGTGRLALPTDPEGETQQLSAHRDSLAPSDSLLPRESTSLLTPLPSPDVARAYSQRSRSSSVSSKGSDRSEAPPTPSSFNATTQRNLHTAFRASPNLSSQERPISDIPRPTFSLLGAIEFRDTINTLRKEGMASGRSDIDSLSGPHSGDPHHEADLSDYFGPITPYSSGHYHSHAHHGHPRAPSPSHRRLGRRNKSVTGIPRSQLSEAESGNVEETVPGVSEVIPLLSTSATPLLRGSRSKSISDIHAPLSLSIPEASPKAQSKPSPLAREIKGFSEQTNHTVNHTGPSPSPAPRRGHRPVPSINLIPADDSLESTLVEAELPRQPLLGDQHEIPPRKRKRDKVQHILHETVHVLFPALQGFQHKSLTGKILGVFASPAIFALTLTLPVVDDEAEGCSLNKGGIVLTDDIPSDVDLETAQSSSAQHDDPSKHFAAHAGAGLHHLILDAGMPSPASPHSRHDHHQSDYFSQNAGSPGVGETPGVGSDLEERSVESEQHSVGHALLFNKYLTAAQCVFGPLFCSSVFFSDYDWSTWAIAITTSGGVALAIVVLLRADDGQNQYWRLIRCFAGFLAAMTWIAAIADAVVDILRVFGHILGLSNAIIGLTIFAIGNSCADLIANLTVASFAPSMSYAACFGGPMLNILLGIGGAGTYVILATGHSYIVNFSSTLWVSAIGLITILVATMCFVPYNGYWITKSWAIFLLSSYCFITILNIAVETQCIKF